MVFSYGIQTLSVSLDSTTAHSSTFAQPRLRLRVTAAAETILRHGHPWLFAESVLGQNREGSAGELAVVYDRNDAFLAVGLYDPRSPIRLRILHAGKPKNIGLEWWRGRWKEALDRRKGLFDAQTTGYRCINGESDGWPGLVLDRYGETFVLKIYTAAWFPHLALVTELFRAAFPSAALVLRLSRNIEAAAKMSDEPRKLSGVTNAKPGAAEEKRGLTNGQYLLGAPPAEGVRFQESGLWFEADAARGQKTGFFLDQRENRRQVEKLSRGRTVLNAFSFSGGFSLYAARGGAKRVDSLDLSAHALESARRNFTLNEADKRIRASAHQTIQADAFEWLAQAAPGKYDLVVLDPPSLAARQVDREAALAAYAKLIGHGARLLRPRGILVAASCSAHVPAAEFLEIARRAARQSGRKAEEFLATGHPPDHPASFKEAEYLKCVYFRFD
jgi:23S rRNA (cytosine1962-C5)-methyltransferase